MSSIIEDLDTIECDCDYFDSEPDCSTVDDECCKKGGPYPGCAGCSQEPVSTYIILP